MLAIFALVPLSILGATGNWRAVWHATKGYGLWWAVVIAFFGVGWLISQVMLHLS